MTTGTRTFGALVPTSTNCGMAVSGYEERRSWTGSDSPNLFSKRENPYSCDITIRNEPVIRWGRNGMYSGTVSSCFGGAVNYEPLPAGALDLLRTNSLKRVMGKYKLHDFNLATFLGELPETCEMVGESAIAIMRSYKAVRKGRFSKAVKILRDINNQRDRSFSVDKHATSNWLALRYGWMPLIQDSYNAVGAYESTTVAAKRKRKAFFRGRSKLVRKALSATTGPSSRIVHTDQVLLRTEAKPTTLQSLGLSNPELVAWELLPFSFVVDWFIGIGTWLELRAVLPQTQATYILTTKVHELNVGYKNPSQWVDAPGFRVEGISLRRTVQNSIQIPPPRFKDPFEVKNAMVRITDAITLGLALTRK